MVVTHHSPPFHEESYSIGTKVDQDFICQLYSSIYESWLRQHVVICSTFKCVYVLGCARPCQIILLMFVGVTSWFFEFFLYMVESLVVVWQREHIPNFSLPPVGTCIKLFRSIRVFRGIDNILRNIFYIIKWSYRSPSPFMLTCCM